MPKFIDLDDEPMFEDDQSLFSARAFERGFSRDKAPPVFRERFSKRSRPPSKKPVQKEEE